MMREPQVEGRVRKSERLKAHRSSPSYTLNIPKNKSYHHKRTGRWYYMLVIAPHHRIPVPINAVELFLEYPITFRHQFLIARFMVNHHRPTRTQLLNTPGYHYKLPIRSYAFFDLVARRHGELKGVMATQR